ncbi:hypothetical protein [Nonomuraea roseoviolacea]|uniref:Exo-alpha-sialidase n=1 Tax=Nonomuraea roseoviolacea subsp. carminata TaxID=160689 RepID=A0ABT1JQC7_9ACTN|nr:hypothetical protein [Nonomuraea roseoviolacea]MCP2343928.1 hypothetical protein [Nonomuraea roseoviolacea subsp. carminata]
MERQQGSTAGEVRDLTVEVSFDDGATWSPAPSRKGEQTVIRAYRIAPRH